MNKLKTSSTITHTLIALFLISASGAFSDILIRGRIFRTLPTDFFAIWDLYGKSTVALFAVLAIIAVIVSGAFTVKKSSENDKRLLIAWVIGLCSGITIFLITFLPLNDYVFPPYTTATGLSVNLVWILLICLLGFLSGLLTNYLYKKRIRFFKPLFTVLSLVVLAFTTISFFVYDGIPKIMHGDEINGPNVIIISIDALRRDYVSAYNGEYVKTPNVDEFAARGYRFEYSYSNSPWTLPSMMTLCTGQYPSVHGIAFGTLPADLPTLAQALKGHGYRTEAYIGNGAMKREYGFEKGFDKYLIHTEKNWYYPFRNTPVGKLIYQIDKNKPASIKIHKYTDSTIWCRNILIERVNKLHSTGQPYFLWVHFMDPHTPLTPPLEYIDRPEDEAIRLSNFGINKTRGHDEENFIVQNKDDLVELYTSEVRYVDDALGSVLETFDTLDIWDDTLVILTADHGEEHFEHGKYGHTRTLYDESTAVPLIIHFPSERSGVIDKPSSVIDIPTTVLSYVNSDKSWITDGSDLYNYVNGTDSDEYGLIYADRTGKDLDASSIHNDEFVLLHYTLDINDPTIMKESWELYRYKTDIFQKTNIIKSYPDIADELREHLNDFELHLDEKAIEAGYKKELRLSKDDTDLLRELGYF